MKIGMWARLSLGAAPLLAGFLAGCGNFWQAPGGGSSTSFTLTNSGNISVPQNSSGASTITVTPGSSFTGTVSLACAVAAPSGASNPATCSLSPASVTFSSSSTTAQTSTLTAAAASTTTTGAYEVTVTGASGATSETTTVCVEVGSGVCSSPAGTSGNFYILNSPSSGAPTIVGESIVSGALTAISGSPWAVEGAPYAMAIAPNGNFLIVSTTSGVFAYPISSGKLGTATLVSSDQAYALQVDATDSWLVEAMQGNGGVLLGAVPIRPATGANNGSEVTASFSVANAAVQPDKMAISGDNSNIFVALGSGGTIVVPFNANAPFPAGIKATTIAVANSGGSALSVAVDRGTTPRLFYIGETLANSAGNSGGLRAINYNSLGSAQLTQAAGSPIASGGLAPNFILPVATPGFVYVANGTGAGSAGIIAGFAVTASGSAYSIAAGSTVSAGIQPLGLAEDSSGSFVLAVGSLGSPYFEAFTFDTTTTGQLDSQITSTTAAGSIAIVAAPH